MKPPSLFDKDFKYTRAKDQGSDYLQRKFERIRRKQKEEREAKVTPIKSRTA